MSHPYWPQPGYIFRRMKAAPVPDAYGGFGYVSMRAPLQTRGSLSPKYDWATPRYIRAEDQSGMGDFGEDGGSCVATISKYLAEQLKNAVGYPNCGDFSLSVDYGVCKAKQAALDNAEGIISGIIGGALSGISGDLSDENVKQQVHNAIASRLPGITIPGLGLDVSGILMSVLYGALSVAADACRALGAGAGGGGCQATDENFKNWCASGDLSCVDATPEQFKTWCDGHGYPWGGLQYGFTMLLPPQQTHMISPSVLAKLKSPLAQLRPNEDMMLSMADKAAFKTNCEAGGGYVDADGQCKPNAATCASCKAQGKIPTWDPIYKYRCLYPEEAAGATPAPCAAAGAMPGAVPLPTAVPSGGGSTVLLIGAAIAAFFLLK